MAILCPDAMELDRQEQLESEGSIMTIDTRDVLNYVDLESFSSQEILEVRSQLGLYQAYIQLKKVTYQLGPQTTA